MGYTHYWKLKSDNADLFADVVSLFKECLFWMPKTTSVEKWSEEKGAWVKTRVSTALHGWNGKGEPVITDSEICFNGDAKKNADHETFRIRLGDMEGNFCKTARKPYDTAVCLALLSFKEVFGDDFSYHSDGHRREDVKDEKLVEKEWKRAYKIFDESVALWRYKNTLAR